jgi:phage/plasmid primase-like uncharacterized protein
MAKYYNYEEIRQQAWGQWHGILLALAPDMLQEALERAPRHVPCPMHGGVDGFRLHKDYEDNGGGVCNTCGSFPSGFRLLQWLRGWDFPRTLGAVNEVLGGNLPDIRSCPGNGNGNGNGKGKGQDDEKLLLCLRQTWAESVPLHDSWAKPARLYLQNRGISPATFQLSGCRCHPNLAYFDGKEKVGRFPALIVPLWGQQGAVTLHRTYLTPNGNKAPVANPKKTMPYPSFRKLAGSLVRLGHPENWTLGLAEGIETALAVREATGQVCWAATSASLLEAVVLPDTIRRVVIWADNDEKKAGQKAALKLAIRLKQEGRKVTVHIPDRPPEMKSWDWNDVLTNNGPSGFPERFWGAV